MHSPEYILNAISYYNTFYKINVDKKIKTIIKEKEGKKEIKKKIRP
jgi:hypothetical protein